MCRWMTFLPLASTPDATRKQQLLVTAPERAGFDNGTYPQAKKVTFGLNITF